MSTNVPTNVAKRAIFIQEFKTVIETKNIYALVATKLISAAKNIYSPFTGVSAAKAHTQSCKVPVGTQSLGTDELVLDRYIGNAILDCEEELSYANFDIVSMYRSDLYASIIKKLNIEATKDFVADATVVSGTVDLSTADKVAAWLIGIAADNNMVVPVAQKVDGARVIRAEKHGKAFVAAGRNAFVDIISKIATITAQSSLKGLEDGAVIETPYGVTIINLGDAADNTNRLIYGTAGVPTMAYREDQVKVEMGEMTNTVEYDGATDLDLTDGTRMIEKTWYMLAQTKGKNGIFSNVQSLVKTQLKA